MRSVEVLGILSLALAVVGEQVVLESPLGSSAAKKKRESISTSALPEGGINLESALTGRFLHITDFHPDPHYEAGATLESGCHDRPKKGKGKDGKGKDKAEEGDEMDSSGKRSEDGLAGRWGTGVS